MQPMDVLRDCLLESMAHRKIPTGGAKTSGRDWSPAAYMIALDAIDNAIKARHQTRDKKRD